MSRHAARSLPTWSTVRGANKTPPPSLPFANAQRSAPTSVPPRCEVVPQLPSTPRVRQAAAMQQQKGKGQTDGQGAHHPVELPRGILHATLAAKPTRRAPHPVRNLIPRAAGSGHGHAVAHRTHSTTQPPPCHGVSPPMPMPMPAESINAVQEIGQAEVDVWWSPLGPFALVVPHQSVP